MRRCACKEPSRRSHIVASLSALSLMVALCGCSQPLLVFRGEVAEAPRVVEEPVVTGSIEKRPMSFGDDLAEEDWRRARAALGVALDPQGNGRPVKWDNPETGLHGTVNPTGLPYVAEDLICRNFLASVVAPGRSRFVRGTGCKPSGGQWTLKRVRTATKIDRS
jgi:surface antigen